jgi:hypothetical protein
MDWISVPFPMTNSVPPPPLGGVVVPVDGLVVVVRLQPAKNADAAHNRINAVKILFFIEHLHWNKIIGYYIQKTLNIQDFLIKMSKYAKNGINIHLAVLSLTHRTACSSGTGKRAGKTLVESASAIFDTSYLRYARQGIPKVSLALFPVPRYMLE